VSALSLSDGETFTYGVRPSVRQLLGKDQIVSCMVSAKHETILERLRLTTYISGAHQSP
jgi:hypothetical protein